MTDLDVKSVLNNRLMEFLVEFPIDVDHTNVDYQPVTGTPYLKVSMVPATSASVGVGQDTPNRVTGFYQVDIIVPSLSGEGTVKTYLDGLQKYFKRGSALALNGVRVRILRFRIVRQEENPDWFIFTVRIEYRSDIEN